MSEDKKKILVDMFIEYGFQINEIEQLVNGDAYELLKFYKEWISASNNEFIGFKRFIFGNEEWEYEHNDFHKCMFGNCTYCDKENGYCKYYGDRLILLDDKDIRECKNESR